MSRKIGKTQGNSVTCNQIHCDLLSLIFGGFNTSLVPESPKFVAQEVRKQAVWIRGATIVFKHRIQN